MRDEPSKVTTHSMSMYASSADYWKAQAEANAKDAERYRWLRDKHPADEGLWVAMGKPYSPPGVSSWRNEPLDAAIDAAMAAERGIGAA